MLGEFSSVDEISAAKTQLETAIAAVEINQPTVGKFYRLKNNQSGWYATSTLRTGEAQHSNKLYMKEAGNTAESVWYLTSDKKLLSYVGGRYLGDMNADWSFEAIGTDGTEGNVVVFNESAVVGRYQILPSSGRALYGDQVRVDAAGDTNKSGNYAWIIEEVTEIPVTITEAGASTLYAPVALSLPKEQGLTVYTAEKIDDYLKLTEVEDVIPANTGVILMGNEGTYNFTISDETSGLKSDLKGAVATEVNLKDGTIYTLQKPGNDFVMKMYNDDYLNGFKAYYEMPAGSNVQALRLSFGETTGIDAVVNAGGKLEIYDMSGRRVEKMTKGLYIVNGQKVLVK